MRRNHRRKAHRGGLSGGGSFAFLVIFTQPLDSVPIIESNRILRGFGGDGGDGGNGAEGGDGNLGKNAEQLSPDDQVGLLACAKPGGRGGDGGKGGYGGGGGAPPPPP